MLSASLEDVTTTLIRDACDDNRHLRQLGWLRVHRTHLLPQRIVNDNGATIGQCLYGMPDIARYDPDQTRSSHLLHAIDGQFEFAFDDLVDFLLRMEVLVDGGAALEVGSERMSCSVSKIASPPARQTLNDFEGAGIYEWHWSAPGERF